MRRQTCHQRDRHTGFLDRPQRHVAQGLARTNTPTPGSFEIPAVPPGTKIRRHRFRAGLRTKAIVRCRGFRRCRSQELDPLELKPANLKLAGQVLDADDKPVAGAYVNLNGEGQPNANARTDREGRFRFEHVCEGAAQISANTRIHSATFQAEGGDTNVVLRLGQTYSNSSGCHGAQIERHGDGRRGQTRRWRAGGGVSVQQWSALDKDRDQRRVQPHLVAPAVANADRAAARCWLSATRPAIWRPREELPEDTTNLDVKLKPALTVAGAGQKRRRLSAGRRASRPLAQGGQQLRPVGTNKWPPPTRKAVTKSSACRRTRNTWFSPPPKATVRSQQQVQDDSETNRMELMPFVLKPADRVLAGQVLNENDKPVSGVNVQLNGEDQPEGSTTTDSKGRFHFQVCEGQVRLFAYSQSGAGSAQVTADSRRHQCRDDLEFPARKFRPDADAAPRSKAARCPI